MCSNVLRTNWFSAKFLFSLITIVNCAVLCSGISLSELYPFNSTYGDQLTPTIDDGGSDKVKLKRTFKFFGKNYTNLYVNNNGILTFKDKLDTYKPQPFPSKENRSIIAPFWADVDTEHIGGTVWFRETFEQAFLDKATVELRSYFREQRAFTAKWMFIVTWENVGYYGASRQGRERRNTFQAVLVADDIHSFVIFNYNKIQWTTGSNSGGNTLTGLGGQPAQAGFNAGDQKNYYSIEGAQTDAVINLTLTSNVGIQGKWVFQVDDDIDDKKCNNVEGIVLSPPFGNMLGGNKVNITGPCAYQEYKPMAYIVETNTNVTCKHVSDDTVACVFPPIFRTGEITILYNPYEEGWNYSALYMITNVMKKQNDLIRRSPDDWIIGDSVNLFWNFSLIPSRSAQLDVLYYSNEFKPSLNTVQSNVIYTNDARNGEHNFVLSESLSDHSLAIMRLSWNESSSNGQLITPMIWSDFFPVRWKNSGESVSWCNAWLNDEKKRSNLTDISSSCPCTLTQAMRDVGRYHADPLCNLDNLESVSNCIYHSNASHCIRRNFNIHTSTGELCCYDKEGELLDIRDNPSGGTHNRYHYQSQGDNIVPYFSFFTEDVLPYLHCCQYSKNSQMCQNFQKSRPPTTCESYNPPAPAKAAGDPHLTTLDGLDYTFNGINDFILVEDTNGSVVIQVRAVQAKDPSGTPQNATVFSAVAFTVRDMSDKVEVYQTETGEARILVNGKTHKMDIVSTSELKDVTISRNKSNEDVDTILIVSEVINLSISLEVSADLINILVMMGEESLKGALRGLLGNFNGNSSDDFIARNGSFISSSSPMDIIHHQFGMTWSVKETENLFSETAQVPVTYEPVFTVNKSDLRPDTVTICKDNQQCKFDLQVTNNSKLAASTLVFDEKFKQIQQDIEKVIRCPYLATPENGNKLVSGHSVGDNATFWCLPSFQMLCSYGYKCQQRICQEDGTWSNAVIFCAEKIDTGKEQEILPVAAGSAGGAGIVLICVVIFCLCYRRRKVPMPDVEMSTTTDILPLPDFDIPPSDTSVFENQAFIDSLRHLHVGGPYRIPRPNFVDPDLFDEFF